MQCFIESIRFNMIRLKFFCILFLKSSVNCQEVLSANIYDDTENETNTDAGKMKDFIYNLYNHN